MTLLDAINKRCSRRKYLTQPIDYFVLNKLKSIMDEYRQETGLNLQLVLNNGDAFNGLRRSYGMFSCVQNYIGLIENKDNAQIAEKLGYYGELLVLNATALGLGTCWVGGSFDRSLCPFELAEGESVACVITVGNVPNEKSSRERLIYAVTHRKPKDIQEMFTSDVPVPDWFTRGMKAVQKAPSAVNRQPVMFEYKNGIITASVKALEGRGMALDLGIAKLHFEIGVGDGKWDWGNGSEFHKTGL